MSMPWRGSGGEVRGDDDVAGRGFDFFDGIVLPFPLTAPAAFPTIVSMNHIAPRAERAPAPAPGPTPEDLGVTAEAMAEAERAADAVARAVGQVVEGAVVVGRRWEAFADAAAMLVVDVALPAAVRRDAKALVRLHRDVFGAVDASGGAFSDRVAPNWFATLVHEGGR